MNPSLEKSPFQMISGLLSNDNPLGSFSVLLDQFGPMLGLLAAVNPDMTRMCLHMAKSMIDEMIRVYDETGQLVFPVVPSFSEEPASLHPSYKKYLDETHKNIGEWREEPNDAQEETTKEPVVSLDMLNDEQLAAARALYEEAQKRDGFIGVYAPTEENFRILQEWREEKEHAPTPPTKQRRKRRTKAQIAADNAAKLARSESTAE